MIEKSNKNGNIVLFIIILVSSSLIFVFLHNYLISWNGYLYGGKDNIVMYVLYYLILIFGSIVYLWVYNGNRNWKHLLMVTFLPISTMMGDWSAETVIVLSIPVLISIFIDLREEYKNRHKNFKYLVSILILGFIKLSFYIYVATILGIAFYLVNKKI